ncbi:uncharacterized protein [Argopecten irradians]|uniref:uncharacterized protein n=1 Tax=Argopecten irradians TaxID=31199 RepID=UPI00371BD8B4
METLQIQIEYGVGKVRKFNIPDQVCTFEELKCDLQGRIESLRNKLFGLQYLDDEGVWIMAVSDTCITEAFRCARPISGTAMRRLKLKTFDGKSPTPAEVSHPRDTCTALKSLKPRSLTFPDSATDKVQESVHVQVTDAPVSKTIVYRSPLQMMMDDLNDEVRVKMVELDSAREQLHALERKYSNHSIKQDKTKSQCGQCHMRLGHTKRNCEWGVCEGPHMCNDIDKHDIEKKQINDDAATTVKTLTKDMEKLRQNLALKQHNYEDTCNTFFAKVLPHLVNTNIDKYYPVGAYGLRALAMSVIHPDIAVLEKHYRGVVPKDLDGAAKSFSHILKTDRSVKITKTRPSDPIKDMLEQRGVNFPSSADVHVATPANSTIPTPPTPGNTTVSMNPYFVSPQHFYSTPMHT